MRDLWAVMDAGEVVVGHWVASASPTIVEVLGHTGADFVAIDCEHGPISPYGSELDACVRAAYAAGVAPVIRVFPHDPVAVAKAADLGATGVIVPHVNSAEELDGLLEHARFPPSGNRGCYPSVRASRFGAMAWEDFRAASEQTFTVVPLLEEPQAFTHLDEILDVPGLRAVAIGPFDLQARLGGVGDPVARARVEELFDQLLAACAERGIHVIDGASSAQEVERKVAAGVRGIVFSVDVLLLERAIRDHMDAVRAILETARTA